MSWMFLLAAIALEISGTTCMKLSQGLTHKGPAALMFLFYLLSFSSMAIALKAIEVSTAYAIWSGIGTAAIAVIGVAFFAESMSPIKLLSILLIIIGVVGVNLSATSH